jgi:outer membrane lipase/esterase
MMRVIKIVLVPILFLCAGSLAAAAPFTALWIFGDSTVDTGWYKTTPSGVDNYDNYMQQPSLGVGKPTSSPDNMSVEVLATALGLSAIPASQTNGTNYATGGAKNFRHNLSTGDGFPNAVPTVTQMKRYLAHHTASSTDLYVISSGDNDVTFALKHPGNKSYLTKAANSLANEINTLQQDGAKFILVAGLTQSFGSTAQKRKFRLIYNTKLRQKLNALGVNYLWGNRNQVRKLIESVTNPFDITNFALGSTTCSGTCSACSVPNVQPPITTDWAYVCSTSAGAPSIPTNAAASEWADDNHYATGGQSVLGTYFYCAAKNKWPTLAWSSNPTLPFDCTTVASAVK